ncbi:MAG: DUF2029 domain-containing protein [Planctomycetes bacterium]|nr:DUF2029 domain-containing protein [Planctomycetota bacterium]
MSAPVAPPAHVGRPRAAAGALALVLLSAGGLRLAHDYVSDPAMPRPHDFLQVWSAGRLNADGQNPYDAERMYALQVANRMPDSRTPEHPDGYASMMWVPPWGLAVAMPLGVLPIDAAQLVWGLGQLALIAAAGVVIWQFYGGPAARWWVPVTLALGSGPVWWQTVGGQNGGLLLLGLTGFLVAHRANRPVLGGAFLALAALKPHLLVLFAVGLLIDAARSGFGRRVVLGGALALGGAAAVATLFNPSVWGEYLAAATSGGSRYHPGLGDWFNPTVGAWVRHAVPGRPFWVQVVPCAAATLCFAVYWWRTGNPARWPAVLPWLVPVSLIVAPYGSWPSDQVLFLIPVVAVAARLDARGIGLASVGAAATAFAVANVAVVVMTGAQAPLHSYVWVAPVFAGCLLSAERAHRRGAPAAIPSGV